MWAAHMITAIAPSPAQQARSSRRVLARAGSGVGVRAREVRIAARPRARWRAGHPTTPEGGAIVPAGLMARLSPLGLWARELPAPPSRRGKHLAVGERSARAWLAHLEEEGLETGGGEYHDALAGLGTNVGAAVRNAGRDVRRVPRAERDASPLDLHLKASGQHLNSLRLVRVPVRWQAPPSRRLVDQEAELPIAVGRRELDLGADIAGHPHDSRLHRPASAGASAAHAELIRQRLQRRYGRLDQRIELYAELGGATRDVVAVDRGGEARLPELLAHGLGSHAVDSGRAHVCAREDE